MPRYNKLQQQELHAQTLVQVVGAYTRYLQKVLGCCPSMSSSQMSKWTKDHHRFIPSSNVRQIITCLRFVRDHLARAYKKKHKSLMHRTFRFLDCGCGAGNILLLAHEIDGYSTTGLEYETEACEVARTLVPDARIIQQDILTFEDYAHYDVIYYYNPMTSDKKMGQFARKVQNDAKVGAVVITYGGGSSRLYGDKRFKDIFGKCGTIPGSMKSMVHQKVKE